MHRDTPLISLLVSEAADFYIHEFGELAGQILHMHAGTAVNVGGKFVSKKK
jgi:hypothetical protein